MECNKKGLWWIRSNRSASWTKMDHSLSVVYWTTSRVQCFNQLKIDILFNLFENQSLKILLDRMASNFPKSSIFPNNSNLESLMVNLGFLGISAMFAANFAFHNTNPNSIYFNGCSPLWRTHWIVYSQRAANGVILKNRTHFNEFVKLIRNTQFT